MMQVKTNTVVSIRYIMKNSKDEVLENTMTNDPVSYLHGGAGIQPLLQAQLEGLKTGDKKIVYLSAQPELTSEDFMFDVIVDEVRMASSEEILLGYPVTATVQKCETDCDCCNEHSAI